MASKALSTKGDGKLMKIGKELTLKNPNSVMMFGQEAQQKILEFSSRVLEKIRIKDLGELGKTLSSLASEIEAFDKDSMRVRKGFLNNLFSPAKIIQHNWIDKYQTVNKRIETIMDESDGIRNVLQSDYDMLEEMFAINTDHVETLGVYVAAGKARLKELKTEVLPKLKEKENEGPVERQQYFDAQSFCERLEKRIVNLESCRSIAVQTIPQIRIIQSGDLALIEKIQHLWGMTIPVWKSQIVLSTTLLRQGKVATLQKKISDTTNNLLVKNSEILKNNISDVVQESERGIVDVDALRNVNENMAATIDEILKIKAEGQEKRKEVSAELEKIESELKRDLQSFYQNCILREGENAKHELAGSAG